MAIPDTFTFCATDVCAELQLSGHTTYSANTSLSDMVTAAPNVTYCSTYKGTATCLRNFRAYELIKKYCSIGTSTTAMVFDGTDMWVGRFLGGYVNKITTGGTITCYTGVDVSNYQMAYDGGHVWTANQNPDSVSRICAANGTVTNYSLNGTDPHAIAFDGTYIWVAGSNIERVTTGGTITDYGTSGIGTLNVAQGVYDGTYFWFADQDGNGGVTRVTSTGTKTRYAFTASIYGSRLPDGIAYDGTYVWVATITPKGLVRITPATGARTYYDDVFPQHGTSGRSHLVYDGEYLWVSHSTTGKVSKATTSGQHVITYSPNEINPNGIAYGGGRVWVSNNTSGSVTLVGAK